jgi:phosphate transport system substrate-binding protein
MPTLGFAFRRILRVAWPSLLTLAAVQAATQETAPDYQASRSLAGTLTVWGPANMSAITSYWAEGFKRVQPGVNVEFKLLGSDTAIPGLYSGQADIALLGRENNITDDNGFSRPLGYPPVRFELTTGSLDVPDKTPALVVFVHRDNPLDHLTLAQLDAIFGHEHRRGSSNIRTWGELGLAGEWAAQPIRLYGYDARTGTGLYFLEAVLGNSRKMNWDKMREFKDVRRADGSVYRAGQQSLDALRQDRYGMAVSCLCFSVPEVRDLALATEAGGPFVRATRESVISRQYPLTRVTYAFLDQPPGNAIKPRSREFLRYVYSSEGQADILREGGYLPLPEGVMAEQRRKLE